MNVKISTRKTNATRETTIIKSSKKGTKATVEILKATRETTIIKFSKKGTKRNSGNIEISKLISKIRRQKDKVGQPKDKTSKTQIKAIVQIWEAVKIGS